MTWWPDLEWPGANIFTYAEKTYEQVYKKKRCHRLLDICEKKKKLRSRCPNTLPPPGPARINTLITKKPRHNPVAINIKPPTEPWSRDAYRWPRLHTHEGLITARLQHELCAFWCAVFALFCWNLTSNCTIHFFVCCYNRWSINTLIWYCLLGHFILNTCICYRGDLLT